MEGNQSSDFLKKIDLLERSLLKEADDIKLSGMPYIEVFRALRAVQVACFGLELEADYGEKIKSFSRLYRQLNISITPKVGVNISVFFIFFIFNY